MHERAIQLRTLGPADIRISAAGLPCLATGAKLVSVGRFEPERAAPDWASVDIELKATGRSGWLPFYADQQNSRHLALEVHWIASFLAAAAGEEFSLDASRAFMNQGAEFVRDEHSYFTRGPPT